MPIHRRDPRNTDPENLRYIQNTSNPVAVAGQLHRTALELCHVSDSNQIAQHPAFRAVLLKLCDMAGIEHALSNYARDDLAPYL